MCEKYVKVFVFVFVSFQMFSQKTQQLGGFEIKLINPIDNTTLGYNAGNAGRSNTSIGYEAGDVVRGNFNTFVGDAAGSKTTFGDSNVFMGAGSGKFNTSGRLNVFIGRSSGVSNKSGVGNVFLGYQTGYNSGVGSQNVYIGNQSGKNGYNVKENVFLGAYTGYRNSTGNENVFIGYRSGYGNKFGNENTFLGSRSGTNNNTGNQNTLLGFYSGLNNSSGSNNTMIGYRSGSFNTSGSDNIFLGNGAGVAITSGNKNVILGRSDGAYYIGNTSNKFIVHSQGLKTTPLLYGDFASGNVSIGSTFNFGYKLFVSGHAYATGLWISNQSSETTLRAKKTSGITNALDKINSINSLEQKIKFKTAQQKSVERKQYIIDAENLQKVFPDLVKRDKEQTAINYQGLIPVLIEAVKELKKENEQLQQKLNDVVSTLSLNNNALNNKTDEVPSNNFELSQNLPNPLINTSILYYNIPKEYQNVAAIKLFDLNGTEIKEYTQLKAGKNQIIVKKGALPSGIYTYSLMVGKKAVLSKKMVIK